MPKDQAEIGDEVIPLVPETGSQLSESGGNAHRDQRPIQNAGLENIQTRVGTLLQTETVSLLLGAGASLDCGGLLIGSVPPPLERHLVNEGISGSNPARVRKWLKLFYLAVRNTGTEKTAVTRKEILARRQELDDGQAKGFGVNYEQVLSTLHRWRSALLETDGRLRIDGTPRVDATATDLDTCLGYAGHVLASACVLPTADKLCRLETHKTLIRKLLTRPLNLKRVNIFTLNYDTLVEQATDATGVVLLDGFVGKQRQVFRPESYEQDLYFPGDTTEGRVHRSDRVLHLYKLHGSITWRSQTPSVDNPYGVQHVPFAPNEGHPLLIYPTPAKYGETLGHPYSELFRRFANALVRPQSVLFVIGYGFGDEHVNAIIRQALAVPSFTLVIVDPNPQSEFVQTLRKQKDRRIWIIQGSKMGTLAGFTKEVLPDLRDEEIRKKVIATQDALARIRPQAEGSHDAG